MSNRAAIVSGNRNGESWRAARSLITLYDQIVAAYPNRQRTGDDATIGDAAHASRTSDHNPNEAGVVCALDMQHDPEHGFNAHLFADILLAAHDERTSYIISNRRIAYGPRSRSRGKDPNRWWKWERYNGENPHDKHIHISVGDKNYYDIEKPWPIDAAGEPIEEPDTERPTLELGSKGEAVKQLQQLLLVDGIFGSVTEQAVRDYQQQHGLTVDGVVGKLTWAHLLDEEDKTLAVEGGEWQTDIIATVFGGVSDNEKSAYDGKLLNDSDLYVAVPARIENAADRFVDVRVGDTVLTEIPIRDVGPWLIDDPYWETKTRPIAENTRERLTRGPNKGLRSNGAGFDISPALARRLNIEGKGKLDWRFSHAEEKPMAVTPDKVLVPVEPAVASKINWTSAVTAALALGTAFGLPVSENTKNMILTVVATAGPVLVMVFRTWFTKSVTPSSVSK